MRREGAWCVEDIKVTCVTGAERWGWWRQEMMPETTWGLGPLWRLNIHPEWKGAILGVWVERDRSDVSSPTGQTVVGSRSGPGGDNGHTDQGQQREWKEVTIVQMTLNLEPRRLPNQWAITWEEKKSQDQFQRLWPEQLRGGVDADWIGSTVALAGLGAMFRNSILDVLSLRHLLNIGAGMSSVKEDDGRSSRDANMRFIRYGQNLSPGDVKTLPRNWVKIQKYLAVSPPRAWGSGYW